MLLAENADVNHKGSDGRTPLWNACFQGKPSIVEQLLKAKATINAVDDYGNTALMIASRNGHAGAVCTLIKHKADINVHDHNGIIRLHEASLKQGPEVVDIVMLKNGANVDPLANEGGSAIWIA